MEGPPAFSSIASSDDQAAFIHGHPEVVRWLPPATKLFKWTQAISNGKGISPWWQFLQVQQLTNGVCIPGIQELQTRAARLGGDDREFARSLSAVTDEWNAMTNAVAITLLNGAWGYIGKAAGQRKNEACPDVFYIGGNYQVWIPGLRANDIAQIALRGYLKPNTAFGAR